MDRIGGDSLFLENEETSPKMKSINIVSEKEKQVFSYFFESAEEAEILSKKLITFIEKWRKDT